MSGSIASMPPVGVVSEASLPSVMVALTEPLTMSRLAWMDLGSSSRKWYSDCMPLAPSS